MLKHKILVATLTKAIDKAIKCDKIKITKRL